MGDGADMALDLINSQIEYFDKFDNVYEQSGIGCRFCLAGPFYWTETEQGWRLWNGKQIHVCAEYQLYQKAS